LTELQYICGPTITLPRDNGEVSRVCAHRDLLKPDLLVNMEGGYAVWVFGRQVWCNAVMKGRGRA